MHLCAATLRGAHCLLQGKEPGSDEPRTWRASHKDRDNREKPDPLGDGRKLRTEVYRELSALMLEEMAVGCLMGKCSRSIHARNLPGNSHFLYFPPTPILFPISSSSPPNIHLTFQAPHLPFLSGYMT